VKAGCPSAPTARGGFERSRQADRTGDQLRAPTGYRVGGEVDHPLGQERPYLQWVQAITDTLQAPDELKRLASYDNVFSATPHRVIEFTFEPLEDAGRYFDRKEISRILQGELPAWGTNVHIKALKLLGDYRKDLVAGEGP